MASGRSAFSGPLVVGKKATKKKSARFSLPFGGSNRHSRAGDDEAYVEITLDIWDDSVAVHIVQAAGGAVGPGGQVVEDPELALLARRTLEKKYSIGSLFRNTSSSIRQVSQELRRLASFSRRPSARQFDRNKSAAAHALKGLKFIASKTGGGAGASGWPAVEKRFDQLTASTNDLPEEKKSEKNKIGELNCAACRP